MVEIIFKGGKVQTGYRIKIPKAIIDTLNIFQNQSIIIKLDPDKREIIISEEKPEKKSKK